MLSGFIVKLAVLTAAIYVFVALLAQFLLILLAKFWGPVGVRYQRSRMAMIFALVWLIAFNLAWWILRRKGGA